MKRITLFAPSIRFAMGQYVEKFSSLIAKDHSVTLVAPSHFECEIEGVNTTKFTTGSKLSALIKTFSPITHFIILYSIYKSKPDIIHILNSEGYPWSISVSLYAKITKTPLIVTVHDPTPHPGSYFDYIASKLRVITLSICDVIHIHYKDDIFLDKKNYIKKHVIVPHVSFADRFTQYIDDTIEPENNILFFGKIEKYKGLETLVNTYDLLPTDIHIVIAGPGKIPHELGQKITDRKISLINKYIDDKEVCKLFQTSKVLVLPYIQSTQSSLPVIARSFGLELIATRTGNFINEIPKYGGTLIDINNFAELAEEIVKSIKKYHKVKRSPPSNINNKIQSSFIEIYNDL